MNTLITTTLHVLWAFFNARVQFREGNQTLGIPQSSPKLFKDMGNLVDGGIGESIVGYSTPSWKTIVNRGIGSNSKQKRDPRPSKKEVDRATHCDVNGEEESEPKDPLKSL
jgi:hypothetical protein